MATNKLIKVKRKCFMRRNICTPHGKRISSSNGNSTTKLSTFRNLQLSQGYLPISVSHFSSPKMSINYGLFLRQSSSNLALTLLEWTAIATTSAAEPVAAAIRVRADKALGCPPAQPQSVKYRPAHLRNQGSGAVSGPHTPLFQR
ncbi:hypothetical protein Pfo_012654 [Paulownia fortunei]|nr:hypothetical protein Pfo_012654 [Paulownia fortunei]